MAQCGIAKPNNNFQTPKGSSETNTNKGFRVVVSKDHGGSQGHLRT